MSEHEGNTALEGIAAQAMTVLVHREFMEHTRKLREKERQGAPNGSVSGLMSMHIDGNRAVSDAYRLALNFNSLADYEVALADLQSESDQFDKNAENTYETMLNLDDEDADAMMDDLMAEMLSPVDSLSRHDVLQRLACVYAVLLAEWDKLHDLGVSDVTHHITQDMKLAGHLEQAFEVMQEAATLDHWNGIVTVRAGETAFTALKTLQP